MDRSVIAGKTVTGFTTEGEVMLHVIDKIRQDKVPTIEEGAAKVGAKYVAPRPTRSNNLSIVDGRGVTGANPASAHSTAETAIKAFDSL
jgi:D-lactate dehydratase